MFFEMNWHTCCQTFISINLNFKNMKKVLALGLVALFGMSVAMAQQPKSSQKKEKTEVTSDTTKKCCKKSGDKKCCKKGDSKSKKSSSK